MKSLLLIGAILGALALAGTGAADSSNRASVTNYQDCSPTPFGTLCTDVKTVTKLVITPSGNLSFVSNGSTTFTSVWDAVGCTHSISDSFHQHWLANEDDDKTQSDRLTQTVSYQCGTSDLTCVSTLDVHFANGEVQFERDHLVCTEL